MPAFYVRISSQMKVRWFGENSQMYFFCNSLDIYKQASVWTEMKVQWSYKFKYREINGARAIAQC